MLIGSYELFRSSITRIGFGDYRYKSFDFAGVGKFAFMIEVEDELVADIPNRANRISGVPLIMPLVVMA